MNCEEKYLKTTITCPTCNGACQVNPTPYDWGWETCYDCTGAGRVPKRKTRMIWLWVLIVAVLALLLFWASSIKTPGTIVLGVTF